MPLTVVPVKGEIWPRLLVNVTSVPSRTRLSCSSRIVAINTLLLVTTCVAGSASSATWNGTFGPKLTVSTPVAGLLVAVMRTGPAPVQSI